jgi:hypothetical protein
VEELHRHSDGETALDFRLSRMFFAPEIAEHRAVGSIERASDEPTRLGVVGDVRRRRAHGPTEPRGHADARGDLAVGLVVAIVTTHEDRLSRVLDLLVDRAVNVARGRPRPATATIRDAVGPDAVVRHAAQVTRSPDSQAEETRYVVRCDGRYVRRFIILGESWTERHIGPSGPGRARSEEVPAAGPVVSTQGTAKSVTRTAAARPRASSACTQWRCWPLGRRGLPVMGVEQRLPVQNPRLEVRWPMGVADEV